MTTTKLIGLIICGALAAQAQNQSDNNARIANGELPIYRVNVTGRTAKAISYRSRSGATMLGFKGTELLPKSHGEAKVESKQGYIEIEVEFDELQPANKQGAEYLTYVLWAITPEGRTSNLGEVLLNGTRAKLNVTTELQVFGLVVTAEPYYSVTRPSDLIVMENVVRPDTIGKIELIDAKYELLQRGQYQRLSNPLVLKADPKLPLELYEARNAVQIARSIGADRFAADTFQKAEKTLAQAEAYQARKAGKKPVTMTSRAAVQTAEDARAIAVKRQEDDALNAERQQAAERTAIAENGRAAAQSETGRVARNAEAARLSAQAESDQLVRVKDAQAMAAREETLRVKRDADAQTATATAEADRLKRENEGNANAAQAAKAEADRIKQDGESQLAAARAETDRLKRNSDRELAAARGETEKLKFDNNSQLAAAQAETDLLKRNSETQLIAARAETDRVKLESDAKIAAASAEADRLKRENEAQRMASEAALNLAAKQKAQLEGEKADLRTQLLKQFSAVLQTRDTTRGLVVNLSDVLFATGQHTLRPQVREKLAKVAGIVASHPGLKIDVEGYTDSVGTDDTNQKLSEQRGTAVRDYLTQNGIAGNAVTTKGMGESNPVATNDTAAGRQQNRRVELVISGEIIGTTIGVVVATR